MRSEALWATFGRQVVLGSVGISAIRHKSSWQQCYLLVNVVNLDVGLQSFATLGARHVSN